jgi:hypothetical protein
MTKKLVDARGEKTRDRQRERRIGRRRIMKENVRTRILRKRLTVIKARAYRSTRPETPTETPTTPPYREAPVFTGKEVYY